MRTRIPNWEEIKQVLEFKTFYLALLISVFGIVLILLGSMHNPQNNYSNIDQILKGLGFTLLTSATISVLTEFFLRLDLIKLMEGNIRSINDGLLLKYNQIAHPELEKFFPSRNVIDFSEIINEADGEILICGVSANDVLSVQQLHSIEALMDKRPTLEFRVAVLSPWSVGALIRAAHPAYKRKYEFHEKCVSSLNALMDFQERIRSTQKTSRFHVRISCSLPSISAVITKKKIIITPILSLTTGGRAPTFIFRNNADQEDTKIFIDEFENLWKDSTPVDRSKLEEAKATHERHFIQITTSKEKNWISIEDGTLLVGLTPRNPGSD